MIRFAEAMAAPVTAMATGIMAGFLLVGEIARAIDAHQAATCPNSARVPVNSGTLLKEWAEYRVCPR
jgi:hypothetical protein